MKRADEEFCRARFDGFIQRFYVPSLISWDEVSQQDEPPDYYLLIDDSRYAVEVTALMEVVSVGTSRPIPHHIVHSTFMELVHKVQEAAKQGGYLQGSYLISFSTPIHNLASVQDEIQDALLRYIQSTYDTEAPSGEKVAFERLVPDKRPEQCIIEKIREKPDRVTAGGPMWWKWEGEAAQDLGELLEERLNSKAEKLMNIREPKILLLLDEYHLAYRHTYEERAHQLSSLHHFHTIFVAQRYQNGGFVLHSTNRCWVEN